MNELTRNTSGDIIPTTQTPRSVDTIDHFFDSIEDMFRSMWREKPEATKNVMNNMSTQETDDSYIIHLQAVGIHKKDIDIKLEGDYIVVSGETDEGQYIKNSIYYKFRLPDYVDAENTTAKLENGILKLMTPKVENETDESTQRTIQIE